VPANTMAKVYIPARDVKDVSESGQPATNANGVTYCKKDGTYAVFIVDSGDYNFISSSVPNSN
jgi:alpha-L-rhamnosidase